MANNFKISPLAPKKFPEMHTIQGLKMAGIRSGIKKSGQMDLFIALFDEGTQIAGVFTQSACAAASIEWNKEKIKDGKIRGLVVNSGNANAFTGQKGREAVEKTIQGMAKQYSLEKDEVFVSSTGVIGEFLPYEKILNAISEGPELDEAAWLDAAKSILTTDTFPKAASVKTEIDGQTTYISGMAKGSGMIAPNMATMLGYIFTDAKIKSPVLQELLKQAVDCSFNSITVDGDTSTSDMVLLAATGQNNQQEWITDINDPRLDNFKKALRDISINLAQQIIRDGEGVRKFVTINVHGMPSRELARKVGLSIGNSPLVKTAIAGEDPNWGRIVMAVGNAYPELDQEKLKVSIGGTPITDQGGALPGYDEGPVSEYMKNSEIEIDVDLCIGSENATIWTCDLTHEYIIINANYRS